MPLFASRPGRGAGIPTGLNPMTTLVFGFHVRPTVIGYAVVNRAPDADAGSVLAVGNRYIDRDRVSGRYRPARRYGVARRKRARRLLAAYRLLPGQDTAEWRWLLQDNADLSKLRLRAAQGDTLARREFGLLLLQLIQHRRGEGLYVAANGPLPGTTFNDAFLRPPECSQDLLDEFNALWDSQAAHHDGLDVPRVRETLRAALVPDSPHSWIPSRFPGRCLYVPGASLCPKSVWLAREKQMLDKLNALSVVRPKDRTLSEDEHRAILTALRARGSLSWDEIREILAPLANERRQQAWEVLQKGSSRSWGDMWSAMATTLPERSARASRGMPLRFNFEEGGEPGLTGNPVEIALRDAFGPDWKQHPDKAGIRERVSNLLWDADYWANGQNRPTTRTAGERRDRRRDAALHFSREFGLEEEAATALASLAMTSGAEPFSAEALQLMLPKLEQGVRFSALLNGEEWALWRNTVFPGYPLSAGTKTSPRGRGPLSQLCALARELTVTFGRPGRVRVLFSAEFGTDPRFSDLERRRHTARRQAARDGLAKHRIRNATDGQIERWLLWVEAGKICPYTGETIFFDDLFGRNPRFNIDHIWPRSRVPGHKNDFNNKTLCLKEENEAKGNRTPWEYFGYQPLRWQRFCERVNAMTEKGMPQIKRDRFLAKDLVNHPVFIRNEANRHGWSVRMALKSLRAIWDTGEPPVAVESVTSRLMSTLHRFWGFAHRLKTVPEDLERARPMTMAVVIASSRPDSKRALGLYRHVMKIPENRDAAPANGAAPRPVPALPLPWPDIVSETFTRISQTEPEERASA